MTLLDSLLGRRCRMCGARGVALLGDVAPTHHAQFHTRDFSLQHCRRCETVYLQPAPTPGDLKALYEESTQFVNDPHYTDPVEVAALLEFYTTSVRNLRLLRKQPARVLEIGAGFAWVSRACKSIDAEVITMAQDVSAECAQLCHGWVDEYIVGAVEDARHSGPFDLISLTHVIEHLVDPLAMLRTISRLLAADGRVFVTAPYRPVGWQPEQGIAPWRDYSYLHVPAHVTYFSRRWFERHAPRELRVEHWDASSEDGQSFELVLHKPLA